MKHFLSLRVMVILIAGGLILLALLPMTGWLETRTPDWVTTTVERGDVVSEVSVSGFVEAKNTAELAFPSAGIVTDVFVDEGQAVEAGEVLATLAANRLVAERREAVANATAIAAALDELIAGPRTEAQVVTETTIQNAQAELERVTTLEAERVENARRTLLSNSLEAIATDAEESAVPPTITGTYTCDVEGTYLIDMYRSSAASGYSYVLSGLETMSTGAYTDQKSPLGTCGLYIQFDAMSNYGDSTWTITIPNTASNAFLANQNAYTIAKQTEANNIAAARDAVGLAEEEGVLQNASGRSEAVRAQEAELTAARARIATIDAQIADLSIVAPFSGVITTVDILPGETAPGTPVITLLAEDAFEVTARIPEIDITKITVGQDVLALFDAWQDAALSGTITFISPLATEIDGVAYFESTITLDQIPTWLRSGLNADIDIIIESQRDVLYAPARFIQISATGEAAVLQPNGKNLASTSVEIVLAGSDGLTVITGLSEGDTIVLPE